MTGLVEKYGMRHAAKALAHYDATEDEREALYAKMSKARTSSSAQHAFYQWNKAVRDAQLEVGKAFYEDTRDRNHEDCIPHITLSFVRAMVEKYPPKETPK